MKKIKDDVYDKICLMRLGQADVDLDAIKAREKQLKFCNFISHLQEKAGFRKWKEVTWGTGCDMRFVILMLNERDNLKK